MEKIEAPKIVLQGVAYAAAPNPKLSLLRAFYAFEDQEAKNFISFSEKKTDEDYTLYGTLEQRLDIIVQTFNNPAITVESLMDNMDLEDLMPVYHQIFKWIPYILNRKLLNIPKNADAPEAKKE